MKILTLTAFAVLPFASFASVLTDAGQSSPGTLPSAPPILSLQPGSSWSADYVSQCPGHGKGWRFTACVGVQLGGIDFGHGWSLYTDLLGGFSLNAGTVTGGYGIGAQYKHSFSATNDRISWFAKVGGAQLFGTGVSSTPGFELAAGVSLATR